MDTALRDHVRQRAGGRCEYCHVIPRIDTAPFCIDHIIAKKHHGTDAIENLALACFWCNIFKSENLSGIDPLTGNIVQLFHPRQDLWAEHFSWQGPVLVGQTESARATIDVLNINLNERVAVRESLLAEGIIC